MNLRGALSTLLLTAVAIALTVTTVVFAPLPLMLLRRNFGRLHFLAAAIVGTVVLGVLGSPFLAALFVGLAGLSFAFCECEGLNISYTTAACVALLVACGYTAFGIAFAVRIFGFAPVEFFRSQVQLGLSQVTFPAGVTVDKEALLRLLPSAVLIVMIASIWINSVLVRHLERLLVWSPKFQRHVFATEDFMSWKLPDSFVWLALASAAGSFLAPETELIHWVASNTFNVVVLLYFFQGLAVVVNFFVVKKVGPFWRFTTYFFIFSQLFLAVAIIGFVDLWMEFRNRIKADKSGAVA